MVFLHQKWRELILKNEKKHIDLSIENRTQNSEQSIP